MFYLWDVHELKRDLIDRRLTEQTRFRYLLAFMLLLLAIGQLSYHLGDVTNGARFGIVYSLITIAGTALGACICYRANGRSEGLHFFERFVSLAIVVATRLCIPVAVVATAYMLWADFGATDYRHPRWHSYLLLFVPMGLFFARLATHLADVQAALEQRLQKRRRANRNGQLEQTDGASERTSLAG